MAVLCLPRFAAAEVIIVRADRDNVLYENSAGVLSNGQGEFLFAGRTNQVEFSRRRAVLHFDVAARLPAGATVMSSELCLYLDRSASPVADLVFAHRLLRDWGESASYTQGGGGSGDSAEAGDATWLHAFFDTAYWAAPGGDFAAQASAQSDVDTARGVKVWAAATLDDDVAFHAAHPDSNFGWILLGDEAAAGSVNKFASREHPDSSFRPMLKLYVVGACPIARTGDVNGDYRLTVSDIVTMVDVVFRGSGVLQPCSGAGDVNCDATVSSSDIVYLVNTVIKAGPAPCDACALVPSTWNCP